MRTLAGKQADIESGRYANAKDNLDPAVPADAKAMLRSIRGGKAARIALGQLWDQANEEGRGYLPTARLSAPLRVLVALETVGVIERAEDDRGVAIRFRLTDASLTAAVRAADGGKK
tara:strand:+ start:436 stop:786 length:351 start_codon:yes stop_codon:yes gene_type:complete